MLNAFSFPSCFPSFLGPSPSPIPYLSICHTFRSVFVPSLCCPPSVLSLLCSALLPVLLCAVCSYACQVWVPVCFLLPPSRFAFLCSACLLCAPLPVSFLCCFCSCFPVVGCGWLSLFPPSLPSIVHVCVCESPSKTCHLSSDSRPAGQKRFGL